MKKLVLSLILLLPQLLSAQSETGIGNSNTMGSVIVTGLPRALVRATKISELPQTADTVVEVPNMTYSNLPGKAEYKFDPEEISAANVMPRVTNPKLYRFYAKAGIGNYTMPLLDVYMNDIYNKKGSYGLKFHHLSSQGGIKNVGFSGFSDNELDLYGKTYFKKHILGADLDYKRNVVHYYGFDPDSFNFSKDTTRQRFNAIGARAYFGTYYPDSAKINHFEELAYYFFNDAFGATENFIQGSTKLHKRVGKETFGLKFDFNYNNFVPTLLFPGCLSCLENKEKGSAQQNFLATLNPTIQSNGKNWLAKVGLAITMDVYDGVSYFRFYPDVEFRYSLFNDIFVPYAGINGGTKRNSYRSTVGENPFTLSNFELQNTNNKINVYGGFKGSISSHLAFDTKVQFTKSEAMPLFVTDNLYSVNNKYSVIYENVDVLMVSGQLNYQKDEKLKLLLRGEYFNYSTLEEYQAWSLPDFKITFGGVYDLYDKIIARADFFVTGGRWARSLDPIEGVSPENGMYMLKLKPFVDLNLGVEYRYSKRVSAFINFNNIAGQRYQYWYNYPVMGINLLGGVTLSF